MQIRSFLEVPWRAREMKHSPRVSVKAIKMDPGRKSSRGPSNVPFMNASYSAGEFVVKFSSLGILLLLPL
ncbi:hypothetical protein NC652_014730 [Populus alba x Populus x berolinensis]|nr:hypothetical protein NC652_014721 [Populus alba x Populus x berolinensis]KAJ6931312.1 hypothetical protein NC652_014724 [Populus alba x Populus x berolinensis]KAJ6931318.1 hypothetical protein NC652_014730 [Populus alba x Populus x berolinensis]